MISRPLILLALCLSLHPLFADEPVGSGVAEFSLPLRDPWIASKLRSMTLEEKIGQMMVVYASSRSIFERRDEMDRLERMVRERGVGGIVISVGELYETVFLINRLQAMAATPLLVSADYERGVAMRIRGGTEFPPAMALAAAGDSAACYRIGRIVGEESRTMGVHQNYAPVVDINTNPTNPVINYRSFGDTKDIVERYSIPFLRGLQHGGMIATIKHYPGHGSTALDSHAALPVLPESRVRLDTSDLLPFAAAINAGVLSTMTGHLSFPLVDQQPDLPASLSPYIIQHILRDSLKFRGIIVTDALEMKGITKSFSSGAAAVKAVIAGNDLLLTPPDIDAAIESIMAAVKSGTISEARIDSSVQRILAAKKWLGLDVRKDVPLEDVYRIVGSDEHRRFARDMARRAVTIAADPKSLLPLEEDSPKRTAIVAVMENSASDGADEFIGRIDRHLQNSVEFRITTKSPADERRQALDALRTAECRIIAVASKVHTGRGTIDLPESQALFLHEAAGITDSVIVVSLGNPYLLSDIPVGATGVAAYLDTPLMQDATAEVLFAEWPAGGHLPVTIPRYAARGEGKIYPQLVLRKDDPEEAGLDHHTLQRIDSLMKQSIRDSAFSCAQALVVRNDVLVYDKSFGTYEFTMGSNGIDDSTMFDLASVSKVIGTTSVIMKLYEEHRIELDAAVAKYLPEFAVNGKGSVTIRNLLLHNSGLPPGRKFWGVLTTAKQVTDSIMNEHLVYHTGDSTVYSDLGFITLGKVVERLTGMPLDRYVTREFFEPLRMMHTMYVPPRGVWDHIAPTELDTVFRKRLVRGEVHDETAFLLDGISGNAGIFSTAYDLAKFMQMLINGGTYGGRRYFEPETIRLFTTRADSSSSRALGWDTKSVGRSLAGKKFPAITSFGHTGFTGTMIWADPATKLIGILLTNRVYPTRNNQKLSHIRPVFYDCIYDSMIPDSGNQP